MAIISADSHVVEGPEVFTGLADQFGDDAPRVVSTEGKGDSIVISAHKGRGAVNVGIMALAATRLDVDGPIEREHGQKPGVGTINDPEIFERPWSQDYTLTRRTDWDQLGLLEYTCEAHNRCAGGDCSNDPAP